MKNGVFYLVVAGPHPIFAKQNYKKTQKIMAFPRENMVFFQAYDCRLHNCLIMNALQKAAF